MAQKTGIEWTDVTWNPVTGCDKVSQGCKNCYAERFAERFRGTDDHPYEMGFDLTLRPERLEEPLSWQKPRRVFVNSMSDIFHEDIDLDYIQRIFEVMAEADDHIFQLLTKRSERAKELASELPWPDHVWMGVSVENQDNAHRLDDLREIPADTRFLSCEPLIGPLDLDLDGIHWVIVGGESGPGCRPCKKEWVMSIRDQCREADVPFFFKQWGGPHKDKGRELDGRLYEEFPQVLGEAPV